MSDTSPTPPDPAKPAPPPSGKPEVGVGWGPSSAAMPPGPSRAHVPAPAGIDLGGLGDSLGTTVRLGVNLLNALLSTGASALAGVSQMAREGAPHGGSRQHCGCHGGRGCGYDCCEVVGCSCCHPNVNGC